MVYVANLLFKSTVESMNEDKCLWEEQWVCVFANSDDDAMSKSDQYGRDNEHSYNNNRGQLVQWVFVKTLRIWLLESHILEDQQEIAARFLRSSEAVSLMTPFDPE
jgi:hypothetical protein